MIANKALRPLLRAHIAAALLALAAANPSSAAEPNYANQGVHWTPAERTEFYSLDQGSRIMLLDWFKALKRPDGSHFLDDGMTRYGYLPVPGQRRRPPCWISCRA